MQGVESQNQQTAAPPADVPDKEITDSRMNDKEIGNNLADFPDVEFDDFDAD